jgi:hypothetical protein
LTEKIVYSQFFELFGRFLTLIFFAAASAISLMLYLLFQNGIFYLLFIVFLAWSPIFGLRAYLDYSRMQAALNKVEVEQLKMSRFPFRNKEELLEPILDDTALNACVAYHNGQSFTDISRLFKLKHPEQARRLLVKGLDILLKEHNRARLHHENLEEKSL